MPRRLPVALAQSRVFTGVSLLALLGTLLTVSLLPAQAREGTAGPRSFPVACTFTVSDDTGLQARVAASSDGDVICINQSIALSVPLDLDDTRVSLVGRDDSAVTLTAPPSARHITVTRSGAADDTLTIDRLILKGGDDTTTVRGGILVTGVGGGHPYGLDVRNSTFVNNVAESGGSIMVTDDSTAIHVSESAFMNGAAATGGGGAIWTLGRVLNLMDATFTSNTASGTTSGTGHGGAIFAPGPATAITVSGESTFSGNQSIAGDGGAIWTVGPSLAVSHATFTGNTSGGDGGGAIYVPTGANTSISVDDSSTFTGNRATSASGGGGAIRTRGATLIVSASSFSNNIAGGPGGAIYVPSGASTSVTVSGGTSFTSNTANSGGAISSGGPVLALTGASFVSNAAGGSFAAGGAVWTTGHISTSATSFSSNNAAGSGGGGAVWTAGIAAIGSGTTFHANSATSGDGGALSSVGPDVSVTRASFTNNSSTGPNGGGAIWASPSVTSSSTLYADNSALNDGGAIWSAGASTTSTGDTFTRNSTTGGDGGAINARTGSVVATNSTFFRNSARADGGAAWAFDTLTMRFVTSADDSAAAGAILTTLTGSIRIPGTVLSPAIAGGSACKRTADASSLDSYVADTSCGSGDDTVTVTTRALLGLDDTLVTDDSTGALVLIPDDTSILVNAAPSNLVSGVTQDQLQAVRGRVPVTTTTVGAVQVLPILITTQPNSTSVSAGSAATFSVAGLPGVGTSVDYQWQTSTDGGATWVNRAGATSQTLTLNSVTAGQDGLRIRAQVSDLRDEPMNSATATLTVITPGPGPAPASAPSAPREVRAIAGDARAQVTWTAPTSSGSFPITRYEVRSTPAAGTCLVTELTCTITGLTNGTAYSFEARALNGAGWGPWSTSSNTITPTPPPPPPPPVTITITGSRGSGADRQVVFVTGTSTGLAGEQVRAHVKLRGRADYRPGRLVDVTTGGTFTWQRTTGKKTYVYFTGASVQSNRVIIPAAQA